MARKLWACITIHVGSGDRSRILSDQEVHQRTVVLLRRLLDSCPVCKKVHSKHAYALVAMAVFEKGKAKSAYDLLNEISLRHWREVVSYQDWDGSVDDVLVYAIKCSPDQIALLIVEDPYEPGANERLIQCELLDTEESREFESAVPEEGWRLIA